MNDVLSALAAALGAGTTVEPSAGATVETLPVPAALVVFDGVEIVLSPAVAARLAGTEATPVATRDELAALAAGADAIVGAALTVDGESSRALVLVPDLTPPRAIDPESLRGVPVRVWAELGRTRLPIGRAVSLAPGTVVELDRGADDPVDLYVSGRHFARGSLVLVDGEWAVEVLEVLNRPADPSITPASP